MLIKVLIVDDHKSVLEAFGNIIEDEKEIDIVGSSTDTSSVMSLCAQKMPDVVLTDISLEANDSGIILTKRIKDTYPHIKVIVMSGFDEITYIPDAKKAGADAFVSKARPISEFVDMIRAVMKGEGSFPEPASIPTISGESPFTDRELEVLKLLCHSYSRQEIAEEMGIAIGTVKRHMENMLAKSGCKNSMELVVFVVGNGWISGR